MDVYRPDMEVIPEELKQDKIEIDVGQWIIHADLNEFGYFIDEIAPERNSYSRDRNTGWIFLRPNGVRYWRYRRVFKIRKDARLGISGPLFSGYMETTLEDRYYRNTNLNSYPFKIQLTLSLNPTRFLHHQELPENLDEPPDSWEWPLPLNLIAHSSIAMRRIRRTSREFSLDGRDNVLIGQWNRFGRSEVWNRHLERYIRGVINAFENEFQNACDNVNQLHESAINWERADDFSYNLKRLETYFEFTPPIGIHPISFVLQHERAISTHARNTETRDYVITESDNQNRYSRFFRLGFGGGKEMKIYAKTNNRVRVELEHNFSECRNVLSCPDENAESGHTTNNIERIFTWIREASNDAALRLNLFFRHIENAINRTNSLQHSDTCSVIGRIFVHCGHHAETICASLINNGRIVLSRRRDVLRTHVRKLERLGILESNNSGSHAQVYVLTEEYRRAFEIIFELENRRG